MSAIKLLNSLDRHCCWPWCWRRRCWVIALIVGLLTSALQTVTQLHDQTLSFVPRLVIVVLVAMITLPWGLEMLVDYYTELFHGIPSNCSSMASLPSSFNHSRRRNDL